MARITIAVLVLSLYAMISVHCDEGTGLEYYDIFEHVPETARSLFEMYMREAKSEDERKCIIGAVNGAAVLARSRIVQLTEVMGRSPSTPGNQSAVRLSSTSNPFAGVDSMIDAAKEIGNIMKTAFIKFGFRHGGVARTCSLQ